MGASGGINANRDLLNNAASDEEFTYSYGDVLSTAAAAVTPASKLADEVKLETAEAIVGTKPTPATNNSIVAIATTENTLVKPSSIVVNYDVLNLNIHRLPGKKIKDMFINYIYNKIIFPSKRRNIGNEFKARRRRSSGRCSRDRKWSS